MERKGKDEEPKPVQVITVEVEVEEAEKLALASTQGELRLGVAESAEQRASADKGSQCRGALEFVPSEASAQGCKDGEGGIRIEVIKGDVRKEIKF